MKQRLFIMFLLFGLVTKTVAQDKIWNMDDCIRYAVNNSPKVRKQIHTNNTYKSEYLSATTSFLPSLSAFSNVRYNFGRAVDPGTNTYTNTSTFNNGYGVDASLPLFNGGQLINQWRMAKMNRQMGMNDLQRAKDDLAINTMQAYVDVLYYRGLMELATEKLDESNRTLYKTRRQEELGLKGKADVVQIEAQVAADDYNLTHQQNLYSTAILVLRDHMNFPSDTTLIVDTLAHDPMGAYQPESADAIFEYAVNINPLMLQADYQLKNYRLRQLIAKGNLLPSISLSAGINTSYFENLKSDAVAESFGRQFKNNRGEYIAINFSLPLFDGLNRITNYRRARNNTRIAQETQTEVRRQLQTAIEQAIQDREGYAKETIQMTKKVNADQIAYKVTLRKFEEGLMSPLDLSTSSNTLIQSKADLLQRSLMLILKCKLVDYYKGQPLYND